MPDDRYAIGWLAERAEVDAGDHFDAYRDGGFLQASRVARDFLVGKL